MKRTCWEYYNCPQMNCPANQDLSGEYCWLVKNTLCREEVQRSVLEKIDRCNVCEFYQMMQQQKSA